LPHEKIPQPFLLQLMKTYMCKNFSPQLVWVIFSIYHFHLKQWMNSENYNVIPIILPSHGIMILGLMYGELANFQLASSTNSVSGTLPYYLHLAVEKQMYT
jgi:hypothetical protein